MNIVLLLLLSFAQPAPLTLDQVKADTNAEHRAHSAIDYALLAERNAETAYGKSDMAGFTFGMREMQTAIEIAHASLVAAGKSAYRSPKYYKYGEQKSRELIKRLEDLEHKLDADERKTMEEPKQKVIEVHDVWLESIMSRKK